MGRCRGRGSLLLRCSRCMCIYTVPFYLAFFWVDFANLLWCFSALAAGSLALKISVDVETVLYAIQDIFTQGLLGYWLLLAHDSTQGM